MIWLLCKLLFIVIYCVPILIVNSELYVPESNSLSPYTSSGSPLTLNITYPSNLIGKIGYFPASFGPSIQLDKELQVRILIPRVVDGTSGCIPLQFNTTEDGTPIYGNALLLKRQAGCPLSQVQLAMRDSGALLIIVYEPTITFDEYHSSMPTQLYGEIYTKLTIPTIGFNSIDGNLIASRLVSSGIPILTPNITMSIHGSGHISSRTKQALQDLASVTSFIISDTANSGIPTTYQATRLWSDINNTLLDPCFDRILGLWCEQGEVVHIYMAYTGITGPIHSSISELYKLRYMEITANYITLIPNSMCTLNDLQYIIIPFNTISTIPDCWDQLPKLERFIADGNLIPILPQSLFRSIHLRQLSINSNINSISGIKMAGSIHINFPNQLKNLYYLDLSNNDLIGTLPTNMTQSNVLRYMDLSRNSLSGNLPLFIGQSELIILDLSNNQISSGLTLTSFNNLISITSINLANNGMIGVLPALLGSNNLITLNFDNNLISGSIPIEWALLLSVITFSASNNLITAPLNTLASMTSLQRTDLSHNRIAIIGEITTLNNPSNYIIYALPRTGISIDLSFNLLSGPCAPAFFSENTKLQEVRVSNNSITILPSDLFTSPDLVTVDFSNNNLESNSPFPSNPDPSSSLLSIDFSGNPNFNKLDPVLNSPLSGQSALPNWIKISSNSQIVKNSNANFFCNPLESTINRFTKVILDGNYYGYSGCTCDPGLYGNAPNCRLIPTANSNLGQMTPTIYITSQTPSIITNIPSLQGSFTDEWYGSQRYLVGIDTVWTIDTSTTQVDIIGLNTTYSSPIINNKNQARVIQIEFCFDLSQFKLASDQISIYNGDGQLLGELIEQIRGNKFNLINPIPCNNFPNIYQKEILSFIIPHYYKSILIVNNIASINFKSRKSSGQHFYSIYSASSILPPGYHIDSLTGLSVRDEPILPEYIISNGVRIAVYIAAATVSLLVLITSGIIILYNNTSLVRAASKPFTFLTLFMLLIMAGSSVLYAIIPSINSGDSRICNARLWLSCLSLMGVLGILSAKSFRVQTIFTSKLLTQVKQVTDSYVAGIVTILLLIQIIMLIIFNSLEMSIASFIPGSGTSSGYRVWQCNRQNGFDGWIGAEIALFAILMIGSASIAFRTRAVPSAFNESSHIMASLFLMIFFMIIIIPLDYLVADNPEGAIIIQGCGQCLLTLFLLIFNFAPKLYYLLTKRGNDKSLIFTQTSVGAALSARKSSNKSNSNSTNSHTSSDNESGISGLSEKNSKNGTQMSAL